MNFLKKIKQTCGETITQKNLQGFPYVSNLLHVFKPQLQFLKMPFQYKSVTGQVVAGCISSFVYCLQQVNFFIGLSPNSVLHFLNFDRFEFILPTVQNSFVVYYCNTMERTNQPSLNLYHAQENIFKNKPFKSKDAGRLCNILQCAI